MDIEKTVDSIMKRANQLAPNSNFKIDGFESVKFRNVVQALVEELAQAAPEVASVPDAGFIIATGYESGTAIDEDLGGHIKLHYQSAAEAQNAFEAITEMIDATRAVLAAAAK